MSHFFYSFIRYFPWIAIPSAMIIASVGIHYRRRKQKVQWSYFATAAILGLLTLLWLGFRGDVNMNHWLRTLQGRTL